jgi:hypothetical protein
MLRGSDEATTVSGDGFKYYMLSLNANSEANSIGFYFDKNSNGGTQLRIFLLSYSPFLVKFLYFCKGTDFGYSDI